MPPPRLVVSFVALAALVLTTWLIWGPEMEQSFSLQGSVQYLRKAGPWSGAVGIILLLGDIILPIPSTLVISALGYIHGVWIGGIFATGGLMASGIAGYGLGYSLGETKARRWLREDTFLRSQALFKSKGGWVIALSRALPILPEALSCTAGLVRMPFGKFLTALACGSLPMGFVFAAVGHAGHEAPALALGLSLLIPALLWAIASRLK